MRVQFRQVSVLLRVQFRQVSVLFRVQFRLVSIFLFRIWFRHGLKRFGLEVFHGIVIIINIIFLTKDF